MNVFLSMQHHSFFSSRWTGRVYSKLVICIWSFCYHKKSSDNDFGAFLCLIDDLLLGISRLSVPICLFSVSLLDCMLFF